jgi:hypothetical protein
VYFNLNLAVVARDQLKKAVAIAKPMHGNAILLTFKLERKLSS